MENYIFNYVLKNNISVNVTLTIIYIIYYISLEPCSILHYNILNGNTYIFFMKWFDFLNGFVCYTFIIYVMFKIIIGFFLNIYI